tara:strand:- start:5387 stop:5899 length:513 start_codon:yes stop_codon:yes gene_type:complete
MSRRISLREFQENLAHRLAEAQTGERRGLLGVQAGNENWLLNLAETGEILAPPPLAHVPLTREWYRGLANVRGTLFGVIDFSSFHGGVPIVAGGHARLLLVGTKHGVHSSLLVTRVLGLRSEEDFEADHGPPDARPWVSKRMRDMQDHPWLKLDIPQLLAQGAFLDAGAD